MAVRKTLEEILRNHAEPPAVDLRLGHQRRVVLSEDFACRNLDPVLEPRAVVLVAQPWLLPVLEARVTLNRPDARNAQNRQMTYDLNEAFTAAAFDDAVKVVVLDAAGPHFSSGHDVRDRGPFEMKPVGIAGSMDRPGVEGHVAFEEEVHLNMCLRWQQMPKPNIARVHGKVIAGGLMLMWVCDIIVASEDASFMDLTVDFGVNGVEWFSHPWGPGIRRAEEMLFSGDPLSALEANSLGLVNRVVPRERALSEKLAATRDRDAGKSGG